MRPAMSVERRPPPDRLRCPHCASMASFEFCARDMNLRVSRADFPYFQCHGCGLWFIAEAPTDLDRYYPAAYFTLPANKARLTEVAGREQFKLDLIRPYQSGGDLLEVGSAWGSFAYAAKLAGYDVTSVEMDERCCQYLREVVGVTVYNSDAAGALPTGLAEYDVVALWHVLEHVQHFEEMLSQLAGLVRPGGIMAIASPNPDAWQFRLMRNRWPHVDAPRHLQLIPVRLIIEILSRHNFNLLLATCDDRGGRRWNTFGWQRLIINSLPSSRVATAVGLATGAGLGAMLTPFDGRPLRGAAYTLILKRAASPSMTGQT